MATWYCDYTNGDDTTGSGASGAPWKTLQKAVNSATGGDTINIADTSAQVLSASISWSSGWTADNTKKTIIQAWANGGAITIQRPDEATARVGATINGNGFNIFSSTSHPNNLFLKNLKFTGGSDRLLRLYGTGSIVYGCEFYGSTNGSLEFQDSTQTGAYNYIHSFTSAFGSVTLNNTFFINNFIESQNIPNTSGALGVNNPRSIITGNIIKLSSTNRYGLYVSNSPSYIFGNTFISDGTASHSGVYTLGTPNAVSIYNNLFYNFDGASSQPLSFGATSNMGIVGYNAYYDCNSNATPRLIVADLTANDVIGTGDPFVDSANDDYSVTGSTAEDAGLGNP